MQNQKINIRLDTEIDLTGFELIIKDPLENQITKDSVGEEIVLSGTMYTVEIDPTINGEYTITLESNGIVLSETVVDISTLYALDFFMGEPSSNFTDNVATTQKTSVNTYGGFYIARYEAGTDTKRTSSSKNTITALL